MPTVRAADAHELAEVGRVLAAAFDDDPVWTWFSPPSPRRPQRMARWFTREADSQQRSHGEVLVDDEVRGAAIWCPPERWKSSLAETVRLAGPSLRLFRQRTPRAVGALSTLERSHPSAPAHWYLALLGTDPAHQGHGVGSALIGAVTDRCDTEGLGAYLESSKERNVAFYARHGFEVRDQVTLDGGPPLWLMWREPKG